MKKITINEIAKIAGVSRGTVDKVLHNRPGLNEALRSHVRQVINETGYSTAAWSGRSTRSRRPVRLVIIIPPINNPYFASVQKGIVNAIARNAHLLIETQYYYCDSHNPDETVAALNQLFMRRVDGLILRGFSNATIRQKIAYLTARETAVITVESDVPKSKSVCYIGEDHRLGGSMAAGLLSRLIKSRGSVAVVVGSLEIPAQKQRLDGFLTCLDDKYPQVKVAVIIETGENPELTYLKTRELLDLYSDLDGLFNIAGCSAEIGQAIIDTGKKRHVHVVSHNFTPDVSTLIKRGIFDFTLGSLPENLGEVATDTLLDLIVHGRQPQNMIHMPICIGVQENIEILTEQSDNHN